MSFTKQIIKLANNFEQKINKQANTTPAASSGHQFWQIKVNQAKDAATLDRLLSERMTALQSTQMNPQYRQQMIDMAKASVQAAKSKSGGTQQAAPHQAAPHQAAPHQAAPHQAAPHQAAPHQATAAKPRVKAQPGDPLADLDGYVTDFSAYSTPQATAKPAPAATTKAAPAKPTTPTAPATARPAQLSAGAHQPRGPQVRAVSGVGGANVATVRTT